jgi:hypothetical protein
VGLVDGEGVDREVAESAIGSFAVEEHCEVAASCGRRMGLSPGYRFEATQALRQVLHRPVAWGMIDVNPASPPLIHPRAAQDPEDGDEHACGAAASPSARRTRPAHGRQRLAPAISRRARRLPRHPPLPPVPWRPAQKAVGIDPLRRVYDLRHTFATFALHAGLSTFDFSRYMGASLTMIDRHYGHLARDGT